MPRGAERHPDAHHAKPPFAEHHRHVRRRARPRRHGCDPRLGRSPGHRDARRPRERLDLDHRRSPAARRASDPDGGDLQVTFEGRKAGATVPGAPADPFTIVAIPDTQNYTYLNRQGTITQQTQWAVSTRSALNTAFVVQLGDLVSEYDNLTQWGHTSTGFSRARQRRPAELGGARQPRLQQRDRRDHAVRHLLPAHPLLGRELDAVEHRLRRLPRPEPVRRRPDRPAQLRQLLPVHRRRAGLPRAQSRVGGTAVRPRLGGSGDRRPPRPNRDHDHPQLREHRRHPSHDRRSAPAAPRPRRCGRTSSRRTARSGSC